MKKSILTSGLQLITPKPLLNLCPPKTIHYIWNLGLLIIQTFTGLFLSFHYISDASLAFSSIRYYNSYNSVIRVSTRTFSIGPKQLPHPSKPNHGRILWLAVGIDIINVKYSNKWGGGIKKGGTKKLLLILVIHLYGLLGHPSYHSPFFFRFMTTQQLKTVLIYYSQIILGSQSNWDKFNNIILPSELSEMVEGYFRVAQPKNDATQPSPDVVKYRPAYIENCKSNIGTFMTKYPSLFDSNYPTTISLYRGAYNLFHINLYLSPLSPEVINRLWEILSPSNPLNSTNISQTKLLKRITYITICPQYNTIMLRKEQTSYIITTIRPLTPKLIWPCQFSPISKF